MGGRKKFEFQPQSPLKATDGTKNEIKNHGYYGLSEFFNEPKHPLPYLYNYIGKPWKTAEKVNYILTHFYSNQPDGLCGNDDCGQMSAWYVLSAIGFYPVNPVNGQYVLGSPLANKSIIHLTSGKQFVVRAENLSRQNIYIQQVTLNGIPYSRSFISHSDILKGGELVFSMGGKPSVTWGVRAGMEIE